MTEDYSNLPHLLVRAVPITTNDKHPEKLYLYGNYVEIATNQRAGLILLQPRYWGLDDHYARRVSAIPVRPETVERGSGLFESDKFAKDTNTLKEFYGGDQVIVHYQH